MICPNCQAKLDENATFCGNCGYNLTEDKISDVLDRENVEQTDFQETPVPTDTTLNYNNNTQEATRTGEPKSADDFDANVAPRTDANSASTDHDQFAGEYNPLSDEDQVDKKDLNKVGSTLSADDFDADAAPKTAANSGGTDAEGQGHHNAHLSAETADDDFHYQEASHSAEPKTEQDRYYESHHEENGAEVHTVKTTETTVYPDGYTEGPDDARAFKNQSSNVDETRSTARSASSDQARREVRDENAPIHEDPVTYNETDDLTYGNSSSQQNTKDQKSSGSSSIIIGLVIILIIIAILFFVF